MNGSVDNPGISELSGLLLIMKDSDWSISIILEDAAAGVAALRGGLTIVRVCVAAGAVSDARAKAEGEVGLVTEVVEAVEGVRRRVVWMRGRGSGVVLEGVVSVQRFIRRSFDSQISSS